ncbi:MAG TPA: DUF2600 family protein [Clostridiales bacterium]|nr:DUF2600 family protein [Clostridiales bacterium]
MGKLTEAAAFYARFAGKVLPEAYRQRSLAGEELRQCLHISASEKDAAEDLLSGRFPVRQACCFLFSMFPGTDPRDLVSFMISLHSIADTLEIYRKKKDIRDEKEIRDLLGCLSAAVDPSRNLPPADPAGYFTCDAQALDTEYHAAHTQARAPLMCHTERCRLKLAVLPSYRQISSKIKKYMQMYIDLQSYRHYPPVISTDLLKTWSSSYLKRYRDISCWELCAAADSFLGIAAMFAAASVPDITEEEVQLLDEFCFPWFSGFCSMLDSVISLRTSTGAGEINFSSFYRNLRECEERLVFFAENTMASCNRLRDSSLYLLVTKAAAGMYLSHPEAGFGMLRLTTSNIIQKASLRPYRIAGFLMRMLRLLN